MAVRGVNFFIDPYLNVTPSTPQYGGVQGEHNATEVFFTFSYDSPIAGEANLKLYVEAINSAGEYDRTEILVPEQNRVHVLMPLAWTQYGAVTTLRLIAEKDGTVAYTAEGSVRFDDRQSAMEKVDGLLRTDLRGAMDTCRSAADEAEQAAQRSSENASTAYNHAIDAATKADNAQGYARSAWENGDFANQCADRAEAAAAESETNGRATADYAAAAASSAEKAKISEANTFEYTKKALERAELAQECAERAANAEEKIMETLDNLRDTTQTDSKYFDVDYDGIISLKPEYRGNPTNESGIPANYPYAISDNGAGVDGSKIAELPERIILPDNVNGEQVTGFVKGMFSYNNKIKEVVLPSNVKTIINGMFYGAIHLEKVENTEQIESIKPSAFRLTRVRELHFPNVTEIGVNAFDNCSCLRVINIGKVTEIKSKAFRYCENLVEVLGGSNVTKIAAAAFAGTRRLKNLPFVANVKNVGSGAFWSSGCDLENLPSDCAFGSYATYKQYVESPDPYTEYWEGVDYTPCKNPLNSLFHQKDPRWADKQIGDYVKADGTPLCWNSGCALIVMAEIYSAFENVQLNSPEEFYEILEEKGLVGLNYRSEPDELCQLIQGLGYEAEYISKITTETLSTIYEALAEGALLYKITMAGLPDVLTDLDVRARSGHAMLGYGINSNGEMLTADSSMHCSDVGIYENHKTAWHIYKQGTPETDVIIIRKPTGV